MIHVVGLGVDEFPEFNEEMIQILNTSDQIFGSARQLLCIESKISHNKTSLLPKLSELKFQIKPFESVVILASGDPLFYGIGKWLSNNFNNEQLYFYPAVSSLQACCHKLGLSMQDCEVISLHGRPLNNLRKKLSANQTLLILTDKYSHPKALATECESANLNDATITVCEQLGYKQERIQTFKVSELLNQDIEFDPLHVSVIQTQSKQSNMPTFPGFSDDLFITDMSKDKNQTGKGMITKREVRLNILSLLSPQNKDVIWDIGAGCGSVAVELAYWNQKIEIIAVEHNASRLECLNANKEKFGVNNLQIKNARAPEIFSELTQPNKVFIGGSDGELKTILDQVWKILPIGGVLVASGVTENTKSTLIEFMTNTLCEKHSMQIAISRAQQLAGQLMYRPNLPVTLIQMTKTESIK